VLTGICPLRATLLPSGQNPYAAQTAQFALYARTGAPYIRLMRPETERSIEDIQQALALLRRHL
jgi:hypothetical protein